MNYEKILHEKNETLRIVGMYSFLFYVVACAVFLIDNKLKQNGFTCFAVIIGLIACILVLIVFIVALFLVKDTLKKSGDETTENEVPATAQNACNDKNQEIKMKAEVSFEQQVH